MSLRHVRSFAWIATIAAAASPAWGQYTPRSGAQPRTNGQSQVVPVDGRQREEAPRQPVYRAENTAGPRGGVQNINSSARPDVPGSMPNEREIPCPWSALPQDHLKFLDELLAAWEEHSQKIERYRCDFERWEYDPINGTRDPKTGQPDPKQAKTYGKGKLRYASPDKGLFKVENLNVYVPPSKPGEDPQWLKRPAEEIGEHWVCDGKRIFEFDARKKQLIERTLPPEMHGKAIVDGPLPFLFGAKADKIKARYWVRLITPDDKVEEEFWLEASPKFRSDAQNFKMVHVIIDRKDFLPKAIQVFDPAFDPQKRPIRTVFTFNNREANWPTPTLEKLNPFLREFFEPSTPLGWKKVVEPFMPGPESAAPEKPAPTAQKSNPFKLPFKTLK